MWHVTFRMSDVTCHIANVTCHMSNAFVGPWDMLINFCFDVHAQKWAFVIMSHVTCRMSHVKCLCWSLGHAEQLLFSCLYSKVSICNAHSPRSAPKVEKKFADNWWGLVYQEISAKINLRPTWPTLPRFYFVTIRKIIGCVRTLKGGRLYQEILREKNSQYYWGAEIIKVFFRGRTRRESMVVVNFSSNVTIDYRKWKIKPLSLWLTKCTLQGRVWLPNFGTMCWVIRCIQCHMTHGKVLYTVHHMILYNTSYSTVPY